jgi:DNA-binding NarL/FixJ family response regulator
MLVLSQYVEASHAADLLADPSGAVGYLLKNRIAKVEEFLDALDRVARGATVLDPQVIAQLLAGQRWDSALAALTGRERQLLAPMAEGHANTVIAQRLVISASAVEKHTRWKSTKVYQTPGARPSGRGDHRGTPPPGTAPQPPHPQPGAGTTSRRS